MRRSYVVRWGHYMSFGGVALGRYKVAMGIVGKILSYISASWSSWETLLLANSILRLRTGDILALLPRCISKCYINQREDDTACIPASGKAVDGDRYMM